MSTEFYRNLLTKRRPRPAPADVPVGMRLIRELEEMEPGQVMHIENIGGRQFSIIATDDLQHILERAKMAAS